MKPYFLFRFRIIWKILVSLRSTYPMSKFDGFPEKFQFVSVKGKCVVAKLKCQKKNGTI